MAKNQFKNVLKLQENQNLENELFQLNKGDTVRFFPGSSLFKYDRIKVYTNYHDKNSKFQRNVYHPLPTEYDHSQMSDSQFGQSMSWHSDLKLSSSGSFHYYYTAGGENDSRLGSGYLLVLPSLTAGEEVLVSLDRVRCQTVISKNLGTFDTWRSRLQVSYESGYNMIHFTPIQELGRSNSAYSIRNQLAINPIFTPPKSVKSLFGAGSLTLDHVRELVQKLNTEWQILSITDIVLNHTSNDSPWLKTNPDSAYNCNNSPHLRPAYLVDRAIFALTLDMQHKRWLKTHGLENKIQSEQTLGLIRIMLKTFYLPNLRLHELYQVNVEECVRDFSELLKLPTTLNLLQERKKSRSKQAQFVVVQGKMYRRNQSRIDLDQALLYVYDRVEELFPNIDIGPNSHDEFISMFRRLALEKNREIFETVKGHLSCAVENVISAIRWERLDPNGPKIEFVSREHPLVSTYFYSPSKLTDERVYLRAEESTMYDNHLSRMIWAHNGWVMNANPLEDFASSTSNVYLRRELIVWGDSVKLYYGREPGDNQYLWKHMRQYVRNMATCFHGLRIDNCHSTPIHVAQHMLDAARRENPELYVVAELFTSDERIDNMYVNKLGISALVREAMSAYSSRDLGSKIYRFGGDSIGSYMGSLRDKTQPLRARVAPAIFYDATHDNESPIQRKSPYDLQATSAIVSMACCSSGSNRGYDELVPHHINVVTETRLYAPWASRAKVSAASIIASTLSRRKSKSGITDLPESPSLIDSNGSCYYTVSNDTGIIRLRKLINQLQDRLDNYSELFVDQVDENVIAITRHNPISCASIVVAARTAFSHVCDPYTVGSIRPIYVPGQVSQVLFEARMEGDPTKYERDLDFINGLSDFHTLITFEQIEKPQEQKAIKINNKKNKKLKSEKSNDKIQSAENSTGEDSSIDSIDSSTNEFNTKLINIKPINHDTKETEIEFPNFVPSSVVAFEVTPTHLQNEAIKKILSWAVENVSRITTIISNLTLSDINYVLFRCQREKAADNFDDFVYVLPGHTELIYSGLAGVESILRDVRARQDQAHALSANLRDGSWLPDYIVHRLNARESCSQLADNLRQVFCELKLVPRALKPKFFDLIVRTTYDLCVEHALSQMSQFVSQGIRPLKALALGTLALIGECYNAPLAPIIDFEKYKKLQIEMSNIAEIESSCLKISQLSIAAGLPHFADGYMRVWGRDTFIALRGLLLLTGRFQDAATIILSFAGSLRHGLIPNLLDGGHKARFNCRDAVWWWLYCIKEYVEIVPNGYEILQYPVYRLFSSHNSGKIMPLSQVMQEALDMHFQGIHFVEHNAGPQLDAHMRPEGFHVRAGVCEKTGFVYGGNEWNCGTWMDKMGSSDKAGTRGKPATPRDGSAVELVALCYSVIHWLSNFAKVQNKNESNGKYQKGKNGKNGKAYVNGKGQDQNDAAFYPYSGVTKTIINDVEEKENKINWSWSQWCNKVESNFHDQFFVDQQNSNQRVNRRNIYKDSVGATQEWADYQLRPNFLVAMCVAPQLFKPKFASLALEQARSCLVGPLGIKTLDPADWNYNGNYNNDDDSTNAKTAHGYNYHQGPEWLWLAGFYIRAMLKFNPNKVNLEHVKRLLANHFDHVEASAWYGLPELTNENGSNCPGSCSTQAWSLSTIIEAVHELQSAKSIN